MKRWYRVFVGMKESVVQQLECGGIASAINKPNEDRRAGWRRTFMCNIPTLKVQSILRMNWL